MKKGVGSPVPPNGARASTHNYRFGRAFSLGRNKQFTYVYRRGQRVTCRDLTLLYVRSNQKRIGFSVSKKVGVAVVRNRTKRRLRECVRPQLPEMRNGLYVFIARPSIAQQPFAEVQHQVQALLRKLSSQNGKRSK